MLARRNVNTKANTIINNSLINTRNNINSRELNKFTNQFLHPTYEQNLVG